MSFEIIEIKMAALSGKTVDVAVSVKKISTGIERFSCHCFIARSGVCPGCIGTRIHLHEVRLATKNMTL